jgi:hypothetical protein
MLVRAEMAYAEPGSVESRLRGNGMPARRRNPEDDAASVGQGALDVLNAFEPHARAPRSRERTSQADEAADEIVRRTPDDDLIGLATRG